MSIRFTALLEDDHGNAIEHGSAELAADAVSINFFGEFIPLYPIGTEIKVVRTHNDKRLDTMKGKVFLSSRNLLRVTGISNTSLENIKRIFLSNVQFQISPFTSEKKRFFRRPKKKVYSSESTVYFLSETSIKFMSTEKLQQGQQMILNLDTPLLLRGVRIQVEETVDFGNIVTAYICRIIEIPQESLQSLREYSDSLYEKED